MLNLQYEIEAELQRINAQIRRTLVAASCLLVLVSGLVAYSSLAV